MQDYLLRAAAFEGYLELTRELGANPAELLERVNIPISAPDNPDSMISYRAFLELLEITAEVTGTPHFGLLLSRRQNLSFLGVLWFTMAQSPNVGTALKILDRFHHVHNQGGTVELQVQGELAHWTFSPKIPGDQFSRQNMDLTVGNGIHILRLLCGSEWKPKSVHFIHGKPEKIQPYRELFRCPVYFDQEFNGGIFDASVLGAEIQRHDKNLHEILRNQLVSMDKELADDFCTYIKQAIKKTMLLGECSIERVAGDLSLSRRTLQRKLNAHETSFKSLLEEVRFETATQHLKESRIPLKQVADILGYSDQATFSRAFKRRSGQSPQQWRKANATCS